jgi:hypothetical protein
MNVKPDHDVFSDNRNCPLSDFRKDGGMDIETIRAALDRPGKSKKGLAEHMGWTPSIVTSLLRHERRLKVDEVSRIREYLGLDVGTVPLVGFVGAGSAAYFFPIEADELDRVPAPEGSTPDTVAVEIRGESLGALFNRWLVFYDNVHRPIVSELIGQLCVVGLSDGQVLVKKVQRAKTKGFFNLLSNTEKPIENVRIEWAAKVKHLVPR